MDYASLFNETLHKNDYISFDCSLVTNITSLN